MEVPPSGVVSEHEHEHERGFLRHDHDIFSTTLRHPAADLAKIYGVETRVLNQAVKRNGERFPEDFTFRLTRDEASGIMASRSQSVILKQGGNIKYLPYVFTEHGAIMAATLFAFFQLLQRVI